MAKHAVLSVASLAVAFSLFSVPLVIKYHVYVPQAIRVASGDTLTIDNAFSSLWCEGLEITSDSLFSAFAFRFPPQVDELALERSTTRLHLLLPNKAQEYWGFHLLRGSTVSVSACVQLRRADVTVVKGLDGLRSCLRDHAVNLELQKKDVSGEDSESQSESDEATSSISSSQGAVPNDTDDIYACKNALYHVPLSTSYSCKAASRSSPLQFAVSHGINESDYYYYVFASDTFLDILPNDFSIEFTIDRTHYDHSFNSANCTNVTTCELPLSLRSGRETILEMASVNGTLKSERVVLACKPRRGLFFIFYAGFVLVIFMCAFQ